MTKLHPVIVVVVIMDYFLLLSVYLVVAVSSRYSIPIDTLMLKGIIIPSSK